MTKYVEYDGAMVPLTEPDGTRAAPPPAPGVKLGPAEVTTDPSGKLVVAFAQLNVRDFDGDVTTPGAFPSVEVPISQWGHASWQPGFLPVGRGRIGEEGNWAVLRGRLFLGTQAGRETYEVLKELGPISEFSYGYNVAESDRGMFEGQFVRFLRKLAVHEVAPVLRGAGIGTHVVEMSSLDARQQRFAMAAHTNDRALLALRGHTAARRRIGEFEGRPVYEASGGRK